MTDQIPDVPLKTTRRSLWERVSVVWLVPVAALAIALGVALQAWSDRGPLIEVSFANAAGVKANETTLRFRDVTVGLVEQVRFGDNLERVIVSIRIDKAVAPYVDEDAQFWVVSPEVTTQGISGLDTVLSGVFIQGLWDSSPGEARSSFEGLSTAPLLPSGQEGLRIVLRSAAGGLSGNSPILYKGVEVGRIGPAEVQPGGVAVLAEAVIFAPHDQLVTEATRFWDSSGFSVSIGATGAAVNFDSLASLIAGGVTFDSFISGGAEVSDGHVFEVFSDSATARSAVFSRPDGPVLSVISVFEGSVTGLTEGAAVELDGIRIGEVRSINGLLDRDLFGDNRVRLQVVMDLRPAQLGLDGEDGPEQALAFLVEEVPLGLRAQLVTGNLLTGALKIQLVQDETAPEARVNLNYQPYPLIPTTTSVISDVAANAQDTLARINALPVEELFAQAISLLDNVNILLASDGIRGTPDEIQGLLAELRGVIASDGVQDLPAQLAEVMAAAVAISGDVGLLLTDLGEQEAVARVLAAVDGLEALVAEGRVTLEALPALIARADALLASDEVAALPAELAGALADLRAVLADVQRITGQTAEAELPAQVAALVAETAQTLEAFGGLLATIEEAGAVAQLVSAIDAFETTALSAEVAITGLPQVIEDLGALAASAAALPLEDLVTQATELLASADALLSSDGIADLPADISAALAEATQILTDLREAGVIEQVNATLDAAGRAVDQVAATAERLPGLITRAESVLTQATATLAGFDESASLVREAQSAIREVTRAAAAVAQLARTIERNPNALIFGR